MVTAKRFKDRWSDLEVLGLITYILNSHISSETGCCAYELHFGRTDRIYFQLPDSRDPTTISNEYVRLLEEDLQELRAISRAHMDQIAEERSKGITPETQNMYQEGDLVLLQARPDKRKLRSAKLDTDFLGPYSVIGQNKNTVVCKHLALQTVIDLPVDRLKIYHHDNSPEARALALELARTDADQYELSAITAYKGNPKVVKSLLFQCVQNNGSIAWNPLKKISKELIFEDYITRVSPELRSLLYTSDILKIMIQNAAKLGFVDPNIQPGKTFYLIAKYFDKSGYQFDQLDCPIKHDKRFLFECEYTHFSNNNQFINYSVLILQDKLGKHRTGKFDVYTSQVYGCQHVLNPISDYLITYELLSTYPKLGKMGTSEFDLPTKGRK